jgi:hypothetical protein
MAVLQAYAFVLVCAAFQVDLPWRGWLTVLPAVLLAGVMLGAVGFLLSVHIRQLENFAGTMNFVIFPVEPLHPRGGADPLRALRPAQHTGGGGPDGVLRPVLRAGGPATIPSAAWSAVSSGPVTPRAGIGFSDPLPA